MAQSAARVSNVKLAAELGSCVGQSRLNCLKGFDLEIVERLVVEMEALKLQSRDFFYRPWWSPRHLDAKYF